MEKGRGYYVKEPGLRGRPYSFSLAFRVQIAVLPRTFLKYYFCGGVLVIDWRTYIIG